MKISRCLVGLVFCVWFSGCESGPDLPPTVPVEGIVTLDGKPVADANVIFIADQGTYNATGIAGSDGRFEMKAFEEKSGVVVGSYKVELSKTIVEPKPGGRDGESDVNLKFGLPRRYSTFTTSGITFTVPAAGDKDVKFELKSK